MYIRMRASVLLVDDNAVQAAIRQTILKRAGYDVIVALSPERALEQLKNNDFATTVGLVITDHIMPGMTGANLVRGLRQAYPSLPVMVISGLEEAESEYQGLDVLFRVKPLLPEALLCDVHSLLSFAEDPGLEPPPMIDPSGSTDDRPARPVR